MSERRPDETVGNQTEGQRIMRGSSNDDFNKTILSDSAKTILSDSQRVLIGPAGAHAHAAPPPPPPMPTMGRGEPTQELARSVDPLVSLLVVSPDAELRQDLMVCFERLFDARTAWLDAETLSRAYDLLVKRKPALSLFDLRTEPMETLRIVERVHQQDPSLAMVGVYNPQTLPEGMEKSELFLEGMRRGMMDFLRLPLSPEEVRHVFEHLVSRDGSKVIAQQQPHGRMISFFSGKGGVGKTTLVSNVAMAIARRYPGQVAVVDSSMDLGNVADYMGVTPNQSLYDAAALRDKLDRDLLTSIMAYHQPSGLFVLCGPQKLEHMSGITEQDVTQVLLAVRSVFRYVVCDTLPLFNAISIAVGDLSDTIVVVTEPVVPAVNGTRELLSRLKDVGYSNDRIRVLLNKYGPQFSGEVSVDLVADSLQRPINWVLPYDRRMPASANMGSPFLVSHSNTKLGAAINELAADVAHLPRTAKGGIFKKLMAMFR